MGLFVLRDIISNSVLLGLNVNSQVSAHCKILTRSALKRSAEETGSSTIKKIDWYHQHTNVFKNLFHLRCHL